ncbi:hypothetical protein K432DRAFT_456095 [Lepidopterella palustris CBS 459.81]|uniref:Fucose-specific lectin n=1 Tax=Lepidopterella palustris CBS 459.81 TaxID=1314670 RepID=A0A8E2E826_9PEZI|nr:hypothetical protein K432DRAFT_456095 [Lepidopterella palustris CBS 459.81]
MSLPRSPPPSYHSSPPSYYTSPPSDSDPISRPPSIWSHRPSTDDGISIIVPPSPAHSVFGGSKPNDYKRYLNSDVKGSGKLKKLNPTRKKESLEPIDELPKSKPEAEQVTEKPSRRRRYIRVRLFRMSNQEVRSKSHFRKTTGSGIAYITQRQAFPTGHVFYIDNNNVIQEIWTDTASDYMYSNAITWNVGGLGTLNIQVSDQMFLRACLPSNMSTDYGDPAADLYLYYSSIEGGIRKIGFWDGTMPAWDWLTDTPTNRSSGVVECQNDLYGMENMWIVNDQHHLEQWWHNSSTSTPWEQGIVYSEYTLHPRTSLYSVTSESPSLNGRSHIFFQDSSNQLHRLDVNGLANASTIVDHAIIDAGTPGTRFTATGNCGTEVQLYYQRNTTSLNIFSFTDDAYMGVNGQASGTVPIVETYGPKENKKKHHALQGLVGFGIFVAVVVLLCCCCCCS